MLHGQDRKLDAHHPADLARPQAASVDDVLRVDGLATLHAHVPRTVRSLGQANDRRVLVHLRAEELRALHVGAGHPGRVHVPLHRVVQRSDEVLRVQQGEEVLRLLRGDELQVHAQVAAARLGHPQEVHPDLRIGQHQPARQVDGAILPGHPLDLVVQLDRVLLETGHVRVAVERVHPARRVPRGSGGQLTALQQDDVGPAGLRQVVQHAGADHASADDDDLGVLLHVGSLTGSGDSRGSIVHPVVQALTERLGAGARSPLVPHDDTFGGGTVAKCCGARSLRPFSHGMQRVPRTAPSPHQ